MGGVRRAGTVVCLAIAVVSCGGEAVVPLQITTVSIPDGELGQSYLAQIVAEGGVAPFAWRTSQGALPPGLSLRTDGEATTISGTPTEAGEFSFELRVTASEAISTRVFSLTVVKAALSIATSSTTRAVVGNSVSHALEVVGGVPPYRWFLSGDALPAGIDLSRSRGAQVRLAGAATESGVYRLVAEVTDGSDDRASTNILLAVSRMAPLAIAVPDVPSMRVRELYTFPITASGGTGAYAFSVRAGTLPQGLVFQGDELSGAPLEVGTFNVPFRVEDDAGDTAVREIELVVVDRLSLPNQPPPSADVGVPFSHEVVALGVIGEPVWSIPSSVLPMGIVARFEGPRAVFSGTPISEGDESVVLSVTDGSGEMATQTLLFSVRRLLDIDQIVIPPFTFENSQLSFSVEAIGGRDPISWAVSATAGQFSVSGRRFAHVTGQAPAGEVTIRLDAADADGRTSRRSVTATVLDSSQLLAVNTSSVPPATFNEAYSYQVAVSGGAGNVAVSVSGGALPAGLSLSGAGANAMITGTPVPVGPAAEGAYEVQIMATDDAGQTAVTSLILDVRFPLEVDEQITVPVVTGNTTLAFTVEAIGGRDPIAWAVSASAGQFSVSGGRVAQVTGQAPVGVATIVLAAVDADGRTSNESIVATVLDPSFLLVVDTSSVPPATFDEPFTYQLGVSGGVGTVTVSVTGGALPAGLSLSGAQGNPTISGTPLAAGSFPEGVYQAQITATDDAGQSVTELLSIDTRYYLWIGHNGIFPLYQDESTHVPLQVLGGHPPYVITLPVSSRPLTVAQSPYYEPDDYYYWYDVGVPPSPDWDLSFTAMATDIDGRTETFSLTLDVEPPEILPSVIPPATVNATYVANLDSLGGVVPLAWSVVGGGGGLPPGLVLVPGSDGTAQIVGTPNQTGVYTFSVEVVDPRLMANQREISLTVFSPPTIQGGLPGATIGVEYSAPLVAAGAGPFTWAVSSGALPPGLTITNGPMPELSGTPTALYSETVELTATDANGVSSSALVELYVGPELVQLLPWLNQRIYPQPEFEWTSGSTTTQTIVEVEVFSDPNAQSLVTRGPLLGSPDQLTIQLAAPAFYYWRIRARNSLGTIFIYTAVRRFKLEVQPVAPRERWDANGDGFPDVAVANGGRYVIFYGSSSGLSATETTIALPPPGTSFAGDYEEFDGNGDGFGDLAAGVCTSTAFCSIRVYRGSATGLATSPSTTLQTRATTGEFISAPLASIESGGDINGNGIDDLLVGGICDPYCPSQFFTFTATGSGLQHNLDLVFVAPPYSAPAFGYGARAGDFTGDGITDVVAQENERRELHVYFTSDVGAQCDRSQTTCRVIAPSQRVSQFGVWMPPSTPINQVVTTVGDFNGDGIRDLVGMNAQSIASFLTVYLGSATGLTANWGLCSDDTSAWQYNLAAGDLNGDGFDDLVFDGWVSYGSSTGLSNPSDLVRGWPLAIRDFDADGYEDLVNVPFGSLLRVYSGNPSGLGGQPGLGDPMYPCPYAPSFGFVNVPSFGTVTASITLPP